MPRPLFAAVALAALAACASAPTVKALAELTPEERAAAMLVPADWQRTEGCTVALHPPPALGELADSAAVHAALERLWEASGRVRGTALLAIDVDSMGVPEWTSILDADLPDSLSMALAGAFEGHLIKAGSRAGGRRPRSSGWTLRFRVRFAERPEVRLGQSVVCRPYLTNSREIARRLDEELVQRPHLRQVLFGPRTAVVQIWIDEAGRPVKTELERSSGHSDVDRIALDVAEHTVFLPATSDGRPIPVVVQIPLTLRFPERQRR